jgi:uncharacterized RDD family membrane protein YckC
VAVDQFDDFLDGHSAQPGSGCHKGEPLKTGAHGLGRPDLFDPFLILVDDDPDLPRVAYIGGRAVVPDRGKAFQHAGSELGAVRERPPFRIDVVMHAVPSNRQVRLVDVDVVWRSDPQGISEEALAGFLKPRSPSALRIQGVAAGGISVASPWRRIAAWMLDYLVILAYLIVVTAASLVTQTSPAASVFSSALTRPITAELVGFLTLTAPVILYFAITEASAWQATLGKRALRIVVVGPGGTRLPFGRAIVREVVRFLPWEMAHALIWPLALPPRLEPLPLTIAGFAAVYLLLFVYLVSLFVGSEHRTVYDRLAGSRVCWGS